jgi:hypothetical protein
MKIQKTIPYLLVALLAMPIYSQAQSLTAETTKTVEIAKGSDPRLAKKKLQQQLDLGVVRNLLETSFSVKITPQVEAKLPELVEILSSSITYTYDPSDGLDMKGRAKISVPSARLKEILTNKDIGAGDIASSRAKILVSIDEYVGVATTNSSQTATQSKITYSHDKSSFSDTSAKASGSESASSANSSKKDVSFAASDSVAVSGKSSSAVAARQDTAVAGRQDTAVASQNRGGSAAGAQSTQYAGAQSTQVASAQSSQYAGAASSQRAFADKSASSSSSASASAFSAQQNNVQQQNDKVNYTIETKMPEFNNAKPMSGGVLASKLSAEFLNAGLELVSEAGLRSEGGEILTIADITRKGRLEDFVSKIQKQKLNADVWATGSANYTIVGTANGVTQCNGSLYVQGRFLETNKVFFDDSLTASARGQGDQECQANLGIALASSLAKNLGERANKTLQAKNSRGGTYTLYLYSASSLSRPDRKAFMDLMSSIEGIKMSEPTAKDYFMSVDVQYSGNLSQTIDKILDKLPWAKADYLSKSDKICVGIEGKGACPAEFR